MAGKLPGSAIQSNTITITQIQTTAVTTIVNQSGPRVSSLIYPGNDTAGNTVGGQTVYINGSGFETNNAIYINGNAVPSKSFISASNISFTTPALSAGIYPVYVINTDSGATAIFVPGYISSAEPAWATAAGSLSESQDELSAWSYSLSATGDAPITYALAVGSSLPTGVSLAANGLISGTITSPSGNTTTYTFSVVATDAQNQDSTRQFTVTTSTGEGVLFANNVLLIHADGTNNQNNHTFLDSSNNNFTITRNGNATQGSYSPFSQSGWSGYFDGSSDYITAPDSAAWDYGTGDFTIECWTYQTSIGSNVILVGQYSASDGSSFEVLANNKVAFWAEGSFRAYSANTVSANKWNHLAVSRSGTNLRLFINGVLETTVTDSTNIAGSTAALHISSSATSPGAGGITGYMSDVRIVKGTAVYTAAFTPPTAPLTPIANTQLLVLQSNRFVDEGPNNLTITRVGDASIQPFSPFVSGLLTSNSHSVYFDGTGDYLTYSPGSTLSSIGTGPLTIEAWVYYTGNHSGFHDIFVTSTSLGMLLDAGKLRFYGFSAATAATNLVQNTWVHVAVVRQSSNVFGFIGGTKVLDTTTNVGFSGSTGYIGSWTSGTTENWPGYISNLRVSNSARYTANFTPSTTQFTSDANTALLTCQSATVIDNSPNAFTITRNGDARPRTFNPFGQTFNANIAYSTANVGGGAYFDGTGDWLLTASSPATLSGDFTVEGWVYIPSLAGARSLVCIGDDRAATGVIFAITADGRLRLYGNDAAIVTGTSQTVTVNSWHHVAFVRSSGTVRLYLNGVVDATTASNSTAFTGINRIGGELYNGTDGGTVMLGYISNYRLINGTAVYTSNFVPPSAPLTNIANTSLLCNFTNAGIFDQTAKNILETVGDAKVSTAQYKYGTGSVVFDGTGDYLVTSSSVNNRLGSGDFTIEMWLYPSNTSSAYRAIIASDAYTATTNGWTVYQNGTSIEMYYSSGGSTPNIFTATSALTSSVWQHFALVRSSGTLKAYVNGTQVASVSNSINFVGDKIFIGDNNAGDYFFNGYIDDLRITKGYARYTSNFTPPTSALKDK